MAVQLRPGQEQVLTGGSDGTPKLYKIFRTRKRVIGDDFNHIRSFKPMPGRIFDLQFSPDGKQFVAVSSTGISGAARVYSVVTTTPRTSTTRAAWVMSANRLPPGRPSRGCCTNCPASIRRFSPWPTGRMASRLPWADSTARSDSMTSRLENRSRRSFRSR
ncbi:MAG: hypothetical protein CM1200mP2_14750 [Planctomycetaceae bacterium]|nr:MAG: hypothetical protein CM1200mP2_14750 [Planctomycetaceae bacterium]